MVGSHIEGRSFFSLLLEYQLLSFSLSISSKPGPETVPVPNSKTYSKLLGTSNAQYVKKNTVKHQLY